MKKISKNKIIYTVKELSIGTLSCFIVLIIMRIIQHVFIFNPIDYEFFVGGFSMWAYYTSMSLYKRYKLNRLSKELKELKNEK